LNNLKTIIDGPSKAKRIGNILFVISNIYFNIFICFLIFYISKRYEYNAISLITGDTRERTFFYQRLFILWLFHAAMQFLVHYFIIYLINKIKNDTINCRCQYGDHKTKLLLRYEFITDLVLHLLLINIFYGHVMGVDEIKWSLKTIYYLCCLILH